MHFATPALFVGPVWSLRSTLNLNLQLHAPEFFSIVHGFNGEYFQQYYVSQGHRRNRLSSAHDFRLQWYYSDTRVPGNASDIHLYWKRHRYLRRNICLESWLRREIQALTQEDDVEIILHHLHGAIESLFRRREQEGIKDTIPEEERKAFRGMPSDAARPFLLGRTERSVDEVEMFLVRGLNLDAYDAICMQSVTGTSISAE